MKRILLAVLTVLAGLVFIGSTFADEKKAAAPAAAPATPAGEMKKDEGKMEKKNGKKAKKKNGGFERIPRGGVDPPTNPPKP